MLQQRLVGVLSLDADVVNQIEHDESATGQAALIVIVASILAGIGGGFGALLFAFGFAAEGSPIFRFIALAFWGVVAWLMWSAITYFIGTKIFDGEATIGEMLRVIGFAYLPLAFQILALIPIPFLPLVVTIAVAIWSLAAVFVAIREGLDLGLGQAFITVVAGWFVYLIGLGVILTII